ncbi:MAG: CbiX/SirB N-terminal domain-containing protein [Myxococcota bacterium]|jgi:sirohydrochlorin ferrochelatase
MRRAFLLVDHGSKREEANAQIGRIASSLRPRLPDDIVEAAHMEMAEPSIAAGIQRCVEAGAQTIVVCPYFLGQGRHTQESIPSLVAAAAAQHPGIEIQIGDPLGMAPQLLDVVERWVAGSD